MIPDSVWKNETKHKNIWEKNGNCSCGKPRELMCKYCQEPMCVSCLKKHEVEDHKRDSYIERLALSTNLLHWNSATDEEREDASKLRIQWQEEETENLKVVKVGA